MHIRDQGLRLPLRAVGFLETPVEALHRGKDAVTLAGGNSELSPYPVALNPIMAQMAALAGFKAAYRSGGSLGWVKCVTEANLTLPELADVASDLQTRGLQASLAIDRETASRVGITPQNIDDTLYDSFGQRQVSTLFTQLNQYHVILEVKPDFQKHPQNLRDIYIRSSGGGDRSRSGPRRRASCRRAGRSRGP